MFSFRDLLSGVRTLSNPLVLYGIFVLFAIFWYFILAQKLTLYSASVIVGLSFILLVTLRAIILYVMVLVNFSLSFNSELQQEFFLPFETVHARSVRVLVEKNLQYDSLSTLLTFPEQMILKVLSSVRSKKTDVLFTLDPFIVMRIAQIDGTRVVISMISADDKDAKTMLKLMETALKR